MSKLRFLFVLFSLVVLAAPARAQDHEHGHGRNRGDAGDRRGDEHGDRKSGHDDKDDDNEVENRNRDDREDNDDNDNDDENEDGDRRAGNRSGCIDVNGNNACDVINRSVPSSLPEMVNAVLISRGQLTRSGRSWLGGSSLTPRFNRSSNRTPREVAWLDRSGAITQRWLDTNGDGRADVVRMYRKGKLVRTVHR